MDELNNKSVRKLYEHQYPNDDIIDVWFDKEQRVYKIKILATLTADERTLEYKLIKYNLKNAPNKDI